jgi:hypothetical protein
MSTTVGRIETLDFASISRKPLQPENCALVVIDVQEKLLPPIFNKELLVRNSALLIHAAQILDIPVLMTTQYAKVWATRFRNLHRWCRTSGRWIRLSSVALAKIRFVRP